MRQNYGGNLSPIPPPNPLEVGTLMVSLSHSSKFRISAFFAFSSVSVLFQSPPYLACRRFEAIHTKPLFIISYYFNFHLRAAASALGETTKCDDLQLAAFASLATHGDAFGDVSGWSELDVASVGNLIGNHGCFSVPVSRS